MTEGMVALLIPFFAIGLGIATMVTWLVLWHRHKMRDLEQRHAERMAAIQQGMELPPDLQAPPQAPGPYPANHAPYAYPLPKRIRDGDPARYLLRGLVWLGVGLALSFGRGPWDTGLGQFGWIAVGIGTAYLIYYAVDQRRYNDMPRPGPGPTGPRQDGPPPPPPPPQP
jgi:hypothetical protein